MAQFRAFNRGLSGLIFFSMTVMAMTPDTKPVVQVQGMSATNYSDKLIYPARIESRVNSLVTADAEGWVKTIQKPIGSAVKRGEIVLILENQDPVYTFASIVVRAPATGYVSDFDVSIASKVTRGQKLFTITDPGSLKITAEVPSADLASLHVGDTGAFRAQYDSKTETPVKVTGLSPLVDARTGTARAEFEFSGDVKGATLPIGILGQVIFGTQTRSIYLLPDSALSYIDGKPFVRVLVNGKMQRKPVELGFQSNDNYEIKAGLAAGDQVIVRANKFVKEGEAVEVEKAGAR